MRKHYSNEKVETLLQVFLWVLVCTSQAGGGNELHDIQLGIEILHQCCPFIRHLFSKCWENNYRFCLMWMLLFLEK